MGTHQFVHDFLASKRQQLHDELLRLLGLPHPLTCQDKWVILTNSPQLRLQHLSRTVPPATASPHLEQHANNLRRTSLQIFGQPDPPSAALDPTATRIQLHLPLRLGGFGITSFPSEACAAAFLSSTARAASALSAAAPHLHPFAALRSAALDTWRPLRIE
jgi:hypothetical protein